MKFSIIIPTIGRETLPEVLQEIAKQTQEVKNEVEVIVVFDNVKPNISKNEEQKIYTTKSKSFSGGSRNLGIEKSTGDILIFIGDDTIPADNWLKKVTDFHLQNPEPNIGLLGKVSWSRELANDPFYKFLENGPQFNFSKIKSQNIPLIKGDRGILKQANWRFFYTSNISVKKEFIGNERFSDQFTGWGFEDSEFGYRLEKKGLQLIYDKNAEVLHNHPQEWENVLKNVENSRINAQIFEQLHPEVKVLPSGFKKIILKLLIIVSVLVAPFSQKVRWWREWKKVWCK